MNTWKRIKEIPPVLVRLMAKSGGKIMEDDELIARAACHNLPEWKVRGISWATSWDDITVGDMRAFCLACGVDIFDAKTFKRIDQYFRNPNTNFRFLRKSPNHEQFRRMREKL